MLPKGPGCRGCPAESWGPYFVPDEVNPDAQVIVVAQNPGDSEERGQKFAGWGGGGERWQGHPPTPLIGKSGWELDETYLPLAGLDRETVECRNVLRCRYRGSNELPPLVGNTVRDAIRHCQRAYWREPVPGQRLVGLGAYALWALTGEFGAEGAEEDDDARANRGIDGWRGWTLPYRPTHQTRTAAAPVGELRPVEVFATYHPAFFYRAHWLKPVGKMDWHRIGRWLQGKWPEPMPPIVHDMPRAWPRSLAYDTEYNPRTGQLIRASVAWREADDVPRVYVVEAQDLRPAGPAPRHVVQHNAEADWPYLASVFGDEPPGGWGWDDTMYAHSALYGTWRHTLDFLGSLYARTNRWKQLEQTEPIVYSGLDALATWDCWQSLERELARDPESQAVYRDELKPLLRHLLRRPSIQVATDRVAKAVRHSAGLQAEAQVRGQVAAGWPLNVSSADQVARWIGVKG